MKWLVPPWCAQLRPMGGLDTLSQLEGRGNRTSSMGNCTRATPTRSGNCTRATNIQFGQLYYGNQIPPCWATVPRYISKLTAIPGQQARSVTPTNSSDLGNRTGVFYHTVPGQLAQSLTPTRFLQFCSTWATVPRQPEVSKLATIPGQPNHAITVFFLK